MNDQDREFLYRLLNLMLNIASDNTMERLDVSSHIDKNIDKFFAPEGLVAYAIFLASMILKEAMKDSLVINLNGMVVCNVVTFLRSLVSAGIINGIFWNAVQSNPKIKNQIQTASNSLFVDGKNVWAFFCNVMARNTIDDITAVMEESINDFLSGSSNDV